MNAVAAAAGSSCRFSVFGPFGDESPEQSALLRLMEPQSQPDPIPAEHTNLLKLPRDNVQLPTSFDWREHGAVTPVYNQGSAGTCWAFSTTENIEGQYFLAGNTLTSLSVEQLVDCDSNNCGGASLPMDSGGVEFRVGCFGSSLLDCLLPSFLFPPPRPRPARPFILQRSFQCSVVGPIVPISG